MPEMDGYELARKVRRMEQQGRWPDMPRIHLVAATADDSRSVVLACLEAGIDECISKPVSTEVLQGLVDRTSGHLPEPSPFPSNLSSTHITIISGV